MRSLKFKNLVIISDKEKKAIQLEFADRFNLIVAEGKNSVGKSTVVKNLFWCLGCEPRFDADWLSLECKTVLEFEIEGALYWVARHGKRIFFSDDGNNFVVYPKITGDFTKKIASIVNFNALLPKRGEEIVVPPPPAYYFLPFYIDQKIGWSSAWNSFDNLGHFSNWAKEIIPYHVGITQKDYFDLTEKLYVNKQQRSHIQGEVDRVDTAISVVSEFVPNVETTLSIDELGEIKEELKKDILELHESQEMLFEELATLRAEKAYAESQLEIAIEAVKEVNADYEFSLELQDDLQCPTCGTYHDNSLVNRFSLLEDKDQAQQVVVRLEKTRKRLNKKISLKDEELGAIREKIQFLNKKYYREEKESTVTLQNILDGVAAHSVKRKVEGYKETKKILLYDLDNDQKELIKDRKESTKEKRKEVTERFQSLYPAYISELGAEGVNTSLIKSPTDHKKVAKSGGAAEGTRAMLAYYLAVYNLIHLYGEEVLSPFVIDTPNQHEQAAKHYKSIVSLIKDNTPKDSQIFLCGMNSEKLNPLKKDGQVFVLSDEHSLLKSDYYKSISESYRRIFETTEIASD